MSTIDLLGHGMLLHFMVLLPCFSSHFPPFSASEIFFLLSSRTPSFPQVALQVPVIQVSHSQSLAETFKEQATSGVDFVVILDIFDIYMFKFLVNFQKL